MREAKGRLYTSLSGYCMHTQTRTYIYISLSVGRIFVLGITAALLAPFFLFGVIFYVSFALVSLIKYTHAQKLCILLISC